MKLSTMIGGFRLPFPEAVARAASLGIGAIQLSPGRDPSVWTKEWIADIKTVLADNGMTISAFCGDIGPYNDPAINVERCETFHRILDLTQAFDVHIVTTHIGVVPPDDCETRRVMWQACRGNALYAESVGACFAVETGPEKAEILAPFLASLDSKGAKVNLDPANLVMCSADDPVKAVQTLAPYIVHTHAKDGVRFEDGKWKEVPLGTGGVDWDNYLAALKGIGFDGYLAIERECGDDPAADIGMAANFLREKLAKL